MNRCTGCVSRLSVVPHQLSFFNRPNCFFRSYFLLLAIGAGLVSSLVARASPASAFAAGEAGSLDYNEPRVPPVLRSSGFAVAAAEGGSHELRFRFQPGDKYFLLSVTEQTTTRVVDGNQQVFTQTVRFGCDLDIEEVEADGCAWAKYSYRQVALKLKGQGVSVEYDSDANQPKMSSRALPLAVVIGEGFYIRIMPQGRIDKINGLQAVVASAKAKVPNIANKEQIIQTIENQFAEAVVKRELEDQLAVFPPASPDERASRGGDANVVTGITSARFGETGDPCLATRVTGDLPRPTSGRVEAGERRATIWSHTEQMDGEEVMVERTFRLKESRPSPRLASRDAEAGPSLGGIAIVDVNIVVRPASATQETVSGGVRMRREISGQGAGQIEIDESTGRIINSVLTQDLVEEIKTSSEGPVRRIPPVSEPTTRHIVKNFQMTRREGPSPRLASRGAEAGPNNKSEIPDKSQDPNHKSYTNLRSE